MTLSTAPRQGLSEAEVTRFHRDGFLGPFPGTVSPATVDAAAVLLDRVVDDRLRHPLYGRFSVRDLHLVHEEVLALFTDPAVVARVVDLLGPDLLLWRSKAFHKAAGEGPLGWHQEWGAFNGEEIGNDVPGLAPAAAGSFWNITAWFALHDIAADQGPIRFARGTNRRRFPVTMAPMVESEFWHDPLLGVDDVRVVVERARDCSLVLDVDTSTVFDGVDLATLTLDEARDRVLAAMAGQVGAVTQDFAADQEDVVELPMRKGEFVLFTERCMHGSGANTSNRRRLAVNCRITRADTVVYPGRLHGDLVDGSNLDISAHRCLLLHGVDRTAGRNVIAPALAGGAP